MDKSDDNEDTDTDTENEAENEDTEKDHHTMVKPRTSIHIHLITVLNYLFKTSNAFYLYDTLVMHC